MFIFISAVFFVLLTYIILKSSLRPKGFPPGPRLLPLLGSWFALPNWEIENMTPIWQKKYGKIIGHLIITRPVVVISGFENVVNGLKMPNFQYRLLFSSTWWKIPQRTGLFINDGEAYTALRSFSLRYLGTVMGPKLESIMEEEMADLFLSIKSDAVAQMDKKFPLFATNTIYKILFDRKKGQFVEEINEVQEIVNRRFRMGKPAGLLNIYPILHLFNIFGSDRKLERTLREFMRVHLNEHKAQFDSSNPKDYTDAFLMEQEKEQSTRKTNYFTDEQLLSCAIELTQASSETIASAVLILLLHVALRPDVQTKIHEELDQVLGEENLPKLEDKARLPYCEAVIYEGLRFSPSAPIAVPHTAIEDTQFNGYTIPKGTILYFDLKSALHDEEIFEQPEVFKPERFINKETKQKLAAFGFGKRSCIGEIMVKNTLFLFVTSFFQKFAIKLPEGFENPNTRLDSGFTTFPKPFKLIITQRK